MAVDPVQAVKMTNQRGEVKYPIKVNEFEASMKVFMVQAALVAWLCCWSSSVTVESSRICSDHLQADNLDFYVDDPTPESYNKFLTTLRTTLTCYTNIRYGLGVLCTESDLQEGYFNVVLKYKSSPITLALDRVNLNLVAYASGSQSYFFQNTMNLKDQLFPGTAKVILPFSNSYASLGDRSSVDLGKYALQNALDALSNNYQSRIPTSLITVIGMVSEAARFKLIQNAVTANFETGTKPTIKMISYEDKWDELSKNIERAKDGKFPSPVELKNDNDVTLRVSNVGQVLPNMALLKYYPPVQAYAIA